MSNASPHTGGCQCGAVRYRITGELTNPHICHCRMCQKAFGSFFAPLVGVKLADLQWTRGKPALFRSSSYAERGFCSACGTPLTIQTIGEDRLCISLGSLDLPESIKPENQYGIEARMPWFDELASLPATRTEDDIPADIMAGIKSYQHPDHDE